MAEEENKDAAEENAEGEPAPKSKKKLIIFAALGLLVIGGLGVGAAMFLSGGDDAAPTTPPAAAEGEVTASPEGEEAGAEKAEDGSASDTQPADGEGADAQKPSPAAVEPEPSDDSESEIDFGDTFKLQTFHLNLGNALENRYVRLEVTLEYSGGETQKKEIEKRLPQLRDAIISVVTRKTREFLLAPDGKDALRKEILIKINRYMKTKIDTVYITDILIE